MEAAKVLRLNVQSVHSDIMVFLQEYESVKTQKEYHRDINQFFSFLCGKNTEQLTKDDVEYVGTGENKERLLNKHIVQYKNHLMEINSNSSVMRKIFAVRSLYKFLQGNGYDVDYMVFKVKTLKKNTNSYDILTPEQVEMMAQLALSEKHDALELHAFILLAATTSIRVSALLNVTWNDIHFDDETNFYTVKAIDKRQEVVIRPFEKWLYDKLIQVKDDNNKLFPNLKMDKVNNAIQRLASKIGVPEYKRIVTHSLRKTAIDYEMKTSGNVGLAQKQSGHKDANTLLDNYTDKTVDYAQLAGIRMMKKVDESVFDLVDKDELLNMLKELNVGVYNQLAQKIQRIVE